MRHNIAAAMLLQAYVSGGGFCSGCGSESGILPIPGDDDSAGDVVVDPRASDAVEGNFDGECTDGVDQDGDLFVDCDDQQCWFDAECPGGDRIEGNWPGECTDGVDQDGDLFVDCDDQDCDCVAVRDDGQFNVESMQATAGATQANAWIQTQCPDDWTPETCSDQQVVIVRLAVYSSTSLDFEAPVDFQAVDLYSTDPSDPGHLHWSTEEYGIGGNGWDGQPLFLSPRDGAFAKVNTSLGWGVLFPVPAGKYVAPMSCDIDEACDFRAVESGEVLFWDTTVCRVDNGTTTPFQARVGFDWLACRGAACPDQTDDWVGEVHSPWAALQPGGCVNIRSND